MIEYRDRLVREWKLQLVVGKNEEVLAGGPHLSRTARPPASSAAAR